MFKKIKKKEQEQINEVQKKTKLNRKKLRSVFSC